MQTRLSGIKEWNWSTRSIYLMFACVALLLWPFAILIHPIVIILIPLASLAVVWWRKYPIVSIAIKNGDFCVYQGVGEKISYQESLGKETTVTLADQLGRRYLILTFEETRSGKLFFLADDEMRKPLSDFVQSVVCYRASIGLRTLVFDQTRN